MQTETDRQRQKTASAMPSNSIAWLACAGLALDAVCFPMRLLTVFAAVLCIKTPGTAFYFASATALIAHIRVLKHLALARLGDQIAVLWIHFSIVDTAHYVLANNRLTQRTLEARFVQGEGLQRVLTHEGLQFLKRTRRILRQLRSRRAFDP